MDMRIRWLVDVAIFVKALLPIILISFSFLLFLFFFFHVFVS